MKHAALYLSAIAVLFIGAQPVVFADTGAETRAVSGNTEKKGKKEEAAIGAMGEWLQQATFFTETKPNPAATHYFILESASWCGPCKALMPQVIAQYPEMKKAGVEVILLANEPEPKAKQYLADYKAEFAGIMPIHAKTMPGYVKGNGIPNMCLIDAAGNTVTNGHGRMVLQWRQLTNQPEKPGPGAVAEAFEGMKFFNGKPSKKAKYYIYLHSSSTCVACKTYIPTIVKAYKKMKKAKVEMIHINHDSSMELAKKYAKESRIKFPCIMDAESQAKKLPGYTPVSVLPSATIVDKHGTVIKTGHASLVTEWEEFCK